MVEGLGPRIDDIWRDADMVSRRETLAQRFLCGRGIEIGALHKPLTMPKDVRVEYVDYKTLEENRARYPELSAEPIVETHIVDDGFVLSKFEAKSVDFIVANHALEHSPDAYGTLARWAEKTRAGGILYFAVPIADRCFDRGRELTSTRDDFTSDFPRRAYPDVLRAAGARLRAPIPTGGFPSPPGPTSSLSP